MSPITLSRKTYNKKERGAYQALLRKNKLRQSSQATT